MTDINTTISEVQIFLNEMRKDLPEVFTTAEEQNKTLPDKVLFLGRLYDVVVEKPAEGVAPVSIQGNTIKALADDAPSAVSKWLEENARTVLTERTAQIAQKLQVSAPVVKIGKSKTLCDVCAEKAELKFSWRAVKAPEPVIDYLVTQGLLRLQNKDENTLPLGIGENWQEESRKAQSWIRQHKSNLFTN